MARTTITIHGMNRLRRDLARVPPAIRKGARDAVQEGAESVRDQIRAEIRVDTGRLKRDVDIKARGLNADVGWFRDEDYYAKFLEFGTEDITADPVVTRAGEVERTRFPDRVSDEVRRALEGL